MQKGQTRTPVQTRSRETRNRILTAARILFTEKGYHGTNAKEIAREAGTATGSFYAYFQDKSDLFLEITRDYYLQIFNRIRKELPSDGSIPLPSSTEDRSQVVRKLVRVLYVSHDLDPELHREISVMLLSGTNETAPDNSDTRLYRMIRETVEELDRSVENWLQGLVHASWPNRNAAVTSALIFRVAEETIHRLKLFPETFPDSETVLDELVHMLCAYLFSET